MVETVPPINVSALSFVAELYLKPQKSKWLNLQGSPVDKLVESEAQDQLFAFTTMN